MGYRLASSKWEITRLREEYDREVTKLANKFREKMLEILRTGSLDIFEKYSSVTSFG